jgi:D-alanine transaminase
MRSPYTRAEWATLLGELVVRNGGGDLYLYVQVSRGQEAGRNHAPAPGLAPTVFAMASPLTPADPAVRAEGVAAITRPDERWRRCDIKSTALLANVLAKTAASGQGATEAILLADGLLREGASSSVLIVDGATLRAPPYGPELLPGTTRDLVLRLAARAAIPVCIAPVSEQALRAAAEIILCYATRGVLPVTRLDGRAVGAGRPGPVWIRLDRLVADYRREVAGTPLLQPA